MEYTEHQLAEFREQFARRKRNQFLVAVPVVIAVLAAIFLEGQLDAFFAGVSPLVWGSGLVVGFGALMVFSPRNWRCPACDSYLGRSTSMRHCPKCGVALK